MRAKIKELAMVASPEVESEDKETKGFEDYELKSMVETLKEAHKIKSDADKMKALEPYLKKEKMAIDAISVADSDSPDPKDGVDGLRKFINKKAKG